MQTSKTMTAFAQNVKRILKLRGMTQRALAEAIGMQETDMSDLLNRRDNTTIKTVETIAAELKVDPGELISRKKPQAA